MSMRVLAFCVLLGAFAFTSVVSEAAEAPVELAEIPSQFFDNFEGESRQPAAAVKTTAVEEKSSVAAKTLSKETTAALSKAKASPVDEHNQIHDDLTRSGLLGGRKTHSVDYRTESDVEDELADRLVIDYQMDNTLYPTMDHTLTPYAKRAPPLEYVGLSDDDRDENTKWGWVRDLDTKSNVNASGFAFEKGQGFWLDLGGWKTDAIPSASYSIDIVFKFDEGGGMRRIFSKDKDSEEGLYVFDDKIVYWPHILHTNPDAFKMASVVKGEWVRVTLTRSEEDNQITGYVNGVICWVLDDTLGSAKLPADSKLNLFQDNQGYSSSGILGRVRIYKGPLDVRHVQLMGRHAQDAVYPSYKYGRRIYRNLVVADFHFQNSLISSVFNQYPLFVNNRTYINNLEYTKSSMEGRPEVVVMKIPKSGYSYSIDRSGRISNFDGQDFTISLLTKIPHAPDTFQNLLSWSNEHSQLSLRVLNSQLVFSTRDKGEDLYSAAKILHDKRMKGAAEKGERDSDYLQSSQNEFLRARMERTQARIREAEIYEARIREVEVAKAMEAPGTPAEVKAQGPSPRTVWEKEADERALRVAAGLDSEKRTRNLSPEAYATMQYQWELEQSNKAEADRRSGKDLSNQQGASAARTTLLAQEALAKPRFSGKKSGKETSLPSYATSLKKVRVIEGPTVGDDEDEGLLANDEHDDDTIRRAEEEEMDLLVELEGVDRESSSESRAQDVWESEIKASLPKTSTKQVDEAITSCFMRGGKWRFSPIDKCSLDLENDVDQAPKAYDEVFDLASSMTESVKADKWVAITITRATDGQIQCYVNGRRAFQYLDRNTTSTEMTSDSFTIFAPDAVAPVNIPGVLVSRLLVYDQTLRSTEIREMVRRPVWSPPNAINVDPESGNIIPNGAPETIENCISFLPIWNARSTHPGIENGATMLWVKNACKTAFDLTGTMCDESFNCFAQSRSWMSCGTVVDTYCMSLKNITQRPDQF